MDALRALPDGPKPATPTNHPQVAPYPHQLAAVVLLLGNRDFSVDETLLPFVSAATAFKHQGFYEEREVRLVAMAGTELAAEMERMAGRTPPPLKEVCKTSRGGRERRHITLFGNDFAPLPLQRVIVGPSRSQDVNLAFAQKIVGRVPPEMW